MIQRPVSGRYIIRHATFKHMPLGDIALLLGIHDLLARFRFAQRIFLMYKYAFIELYK